MPLFEGIPRTLTKNRSNREEILTTPGIIPYISNARNVMEAARETMNPFHENSYFLNNTQGRLQELQAG